MCVSKVQHTTGRTGLDRFFFGFSIFRQTSQLATEKNQNLCNRNQWSGLLQLGSVRFRSFFQSSELDLRTLLLKAMLCHLVLDSSCNNQHLQFITSFNPGTNMVISEVFVNGACACSSSKWGFVHAQIDCVLLSLIMRYEMIWVKITYWQNRQHWQSTSFSVKKGQILFALLPFQFPTGVRWGLLWQPALGDPWGWSVALGILSCEVDGLGGGNDSVLSGEIGVSGQCS